MKRLTHCFRITHSSNLDDRPLTIKILGNHCKTHPFINAFFDKVLVMAEDQKVKENRLGLLQRIAGLSNGIADLSHLEGF